MWIHFYVYCGQENKYYDTYKYYPHNVLKSEIEGFLEEWKQEHWWSSGEYGYQRIENPPYNWIKERVSHG